MEEHICLRKGAESKNYFDDDSEGGSTGSKSGKVKTVKTSTTDPDSGVMHIDGKYKFTYSPE